MLICCFFFIWREKSARTAFFDMWTCPHIGPKLACRRPGTKYCVDLFFFLENTLELFPPSDDIFSSVSSNPTFHHGLCFFAIVAAFLFATIPPYLGEYRTSTSGTLLGALAASSFFMLSSAAAAEDVESSKTRR